MTATLAGNGLAPSARTQALHNFSVHSAHDDHSNGTAHGTWLAKVFKRSCSCARSQHECSLLLHRLQVSSRTPGRQLPAQHWALHSSLWQHCQDRSCLEACPCCLRRSLTRDLCYRHRSSRVDPQTRARQGTLGVWCRRSSTHPAKGDALYYRLFDLLQAGLGFRCVWTGRQCGR